MQIEKGTFKFQNNITDDPWRSSIYEYQSMKASIPFMYKLMEAGDWEVY
jgi:hypothetical protein